MSRRLRSLAVAAILAATAVMSTADVPAGPWTTVFLAAQTPPPPPPPPPPPGTAVGVGQTPAPGQVSLPNDGTSAISGVVVDASTNRPLAGAVVSLGGPIAMPGSSPRAPSTRLTREITDATGRFVFARLPAGDYDISVTRVGYADGGYGRDLTPAGRRVTVADGEWFGNARVTLARYGALGGTITDEAGEPVVGAYVRALTRQPVSGRTQLVAGPLGRTDDRGVYRIAGVTPGRYLIEVLSVESSVSADASDATLAGMTDADYAQAVAAGRTIRGLDDPSISTDGATRLIVGAFSTPPPVVNGRLQVYPLMFYPSARSVTDASAIDLGVGEERRDLDIQLPPVPAVRVSGTLVGPPEATPAGMTVRLIATGLEGLAAGSEVATSLVRSDGAFAFLGVPAGDYTLSAARSQMEYTQRSVISATSSLPDAPGSQFFSGGGGVVASAPAGVNYSYESARGATLFSARASISVENRDLADVVLTLKRGVTLSGRIVYETPRPSSRAIGFPIYAEPANGDAVLGMPSGRQDYVNETLSTFSIDGLLPGEYTVRTFALGPLNVIRSITSDGRDVTFRPFDTGSGVDISNVVITVTDKVAKLSGFVHADQNAIATHAAVIIFPAEHDQWTGYGFTPRRILTAQIASNGSYRYTALPAGDYNLIAVDDAQGTAWQDPAFLARAERLATRLTLDWNDTKSVDLVVKTVPAP